MAVVAVFAVVAAVTPLATLAALTLLAALAALAALAFTVVVAVGDTPGDVCHTSTLGHRTDQVKKLTKYSPWPLKPPRGAIRCG